MPSVTEAIKRLSQEGYVEHISRDYVGLTARGQKAAYRIANRHTFLSSFLSVVFQIPVAQADEEACALEHHLSNETLEKFILLYQFVLYCPKRDETIISNFKKCLRAAEGLEKDDPLCSSCFIKEKFPHYHDGGRIIHTLMVDMKPGQKGEVILLGPETQMRRDIIERGLMPGIEVMMERISYEGSPFIISTGGLKLEIEPEQASMIEVAIQLS